MPFFSSLGATFGRLLIVVAAVLNAVTTLAGNGKPGDMENETDFATPDYYDQNAQFNVPQGVAMDSLGNKYVSEYGSNRIRKITPLGIVSTFAGSGTAAFADGIGTNASFNNPFGLAFDSSGNLYVADSVNCRIRKITPAGVVTTLAGNGTGPGQGGYAIGLGTNARFNSPLGVAVNSAGTVYVSDYSNRMIRKITPEGLVSDLAGSGLYGTTDGQGTDASFYAPIFIALDSSGNVYVVEGSRNYRIRKITPGGLVSTFAGTTVGYLDETGTNARFNSPAGVAVDSDGNVYVSERNRIRKITPGGVVSTLVGTTIANAYDGFAEGVGTNAKFSTLEGLIVDSAGNLYVADSYNHRIRKITPAGLASTIAGSGVQGYADTIPPFKFNSPRGVAVDSAGNVYVADSSNHLIRKITPAGVLSTFAGQPVSGSADGIGMDANFNTPYGIAVDISGNVYVTDQLNNRIRKITPGGVVSTLAGSTAGYLDGSGANAQFQGLRGLTVDSAGNVYVVEGTPSHRIRKITPLGVVSTLAGNGVATLTDGTGTNAQFYTPHAITIDSAGNLYVGQENANTGANYRIRKVTPGGEVSTLPGVVTTACFGIALDSTGNIYVSQNHLIRKVTPAGVVTILAGSGSVTFADGVGTNATFYNPRGLAIDSAGNIYVADQTNNRIRKITPEVVVSTFIGRATAGYSDGGRLYPFGVSVDSDGFVYAADGIGRIARITPGGIVRTFRTGFVFPQGVAVNPGGTVYVADTGTRTIRSFTPPAATSILAGIANTSGSNDTILLSSRFNFPIGITIDQENTLYVSDINNHNIRKIMPTSNSVITLAGSLTPTFADGVGTNASFNTPYGVAADIFGNVYVADTNNHRIRRITSNGLVMTLAGQATAGYADGVGTNAQFNFPYQISIDTLGTLYVADRGNHRIRTIQPSTGLVSTLAGTGAVGFGNGNPLQATFNFPRGITIDGLRNAYVSDTNNYSIRKIPEVYTLPDNNGVVITLSGNGSAQFQNGSGTNAYFNLPRGVAVDFFGNVFVADLLNHRIRKITPLGVVTTVAGSGTAQSTDSTGVGASFSSPWGIAVDSEGTMYVGEFGGNRIRKITSAGVTSTFAGNGTAAFLDGTGTSARLNNPQAVALDRDRNVYVADTINYRIRKITPAGVVTTLAGNGSATAVDGTGVGASFTSPQGVAVDINGFVYVADYGSHRIRKITPGGVVSTFAGTTQGFQNGSGTNARFNFPRGVTVDSAGFVYVADESNHCIRKITPGGVVSTLAGTTQGYQDGSGTNARFNFPVGMAVDSTGNVYVGDRSNNRIRKIGQSVKLPLNNRLVTTLAGNGTAAFVEANRTSASFNQPRGITVDKISRYVYVADSANHRIRRITPVTGFSSVICGNGTAGFTSGTTTQASFRNPNGVAVNLAGLVYVADTNNHCIRRMTATGLVVTWAGTGTLGYQEGAGGSARFSSPWGVAVDSEDTVYVADQGNNRIRKITSSAVVSVLAGSTAGYLDGTGTNALFNGPQVIAVDTEMNVYVGENNGHRIRKITRAGVVTTFAGSGSPGSADGVGTNASFNQPRGLAVDSAGNVYVADQNNNRIRKITPAGEVSTLAGNTQGYLDGTGTSASFNLPEGIAVDVGGIIYVSDTNNHRIRDIQ